MKTKILILESYPQRASFIEAMIKETLKNYDNLHVELTTYPVYNKPLTPPDFWEITKNTNKIIISGGALGVYEIKKYPYLVPLKETLKVYLRQNLNIQKEEKTLLGICFGHQLLGEILGGRVKRKKEAIIGSEYITRLKTNPLFAGFPKTFSFFEYHRDYLLPPSSLEILATSQEETMIEAFSFKNIYGVQFHPEIDLNQGNTLLQDAYKKQPSILQTKQETFFQTYKKELSILFFYNFLTKTP